MCKSPTGYFTQFRKACSQGLLFIPAHSSQITNVSKRIMLFAKSEYANKVSPSKTWTTPTHARRTTLRPDEMPKKKHPRGHTRSLGKIPQSGNPPFSSLLSPLPISFEYHNHAFCTPTHPLSKKGGRTGRDVPLRIRSVFLCIPS